MRRTLKELDDANRALCLQLTRPDLADAQKIAISAFIAAIDWAMGGENRAIDAVKDGRQIRPRSAEEVRGATDKLDLDLANMREKL